MYTYMYMYIYMYLLIYVFVYSICRSLFKFSNEKRPTSRTIVS